MPSFTVCLFIVSAFVSAAALFIDFRRGYYTHAIFDLFMVVACAAIAIALN